MNNRRRTIFRYENKTYAHLDRVIPKENGIVFLRTLHKNDVVNGINIYNHMPVYAEFKWMNVNIEFSDCISVDDYLYPFKLFLVKKQDVSEKRKRKKRVKKRSFFGNKSKNVWK